MSDKVYLQKEVGGLERLDFPDSKTIQSNNYEPTWVWLFQTYAETRENPEERSSTIEDYELNIILPEQENKKENKSGKSSEDNYNELVSWFKNNSTQQNLINAVVTNKNDSLSTAYFNSCKNIETVLNQVNELAPPINNADITKLTSTPKVFEDKFLTPYRNFVHNNLDKQGTKISKDLGTKIDDKNTITDFTKFLSFMSNSDKNFNTLSPNFVVALYQLFKPRSKEYVFSNKYPAAFVDDNAGENKKDLFSKLNLSNISIFQKALNNLAANGNIADNSKHNLLKKLDKKFQANYLAFLAITNFIVDNVELLKTPKNEDEPSSLSEVAFSTPISKLADAAEKPAPKLKGWVDKAAAQSDNGLNKKIIKANTYKQETITSKNARQELANKRAGEAEEDFAKSEFELQMLFNLAKFAANKILPSKTGFPTELKCASFKLISLGKVNSDKQLNSLLTDIEVSKSNDASISIYTISSSAAKEDSEHKVLSTKGPDFIKKDVNTLVKDVFGSGLKAKLKKSGKKLFGLDSSSVNPDELAKAMNDQLSGKDNNDNNSNKSSLDKKIDEIIDQATKALVKEDPKWSDKKENEKNELIQKRAFEIFQSGIFQSAKNRYYQRIKERLNYGSYSDLINSSDWKNAKDYNEKLEILKNRKDTDDNKITDDKVNIEADNYLKDNHDVYNKAVAAAKENKLYNLSTDKDVQEGIVIFFEYLYASKNLKAEAKKAESKFGLDEKLIDAYNILAVCDEKKFNSYSDFVDTSKSETRLKSLSDSECNKYKKSLDDIIAAQTTLKNDVEVDLPKQKNITQDFINKIEQDINKLKKLIEKNSKFIDKLNILNSSDENEQLYFEEIKKIFEKRIKSELNDAIENENDFKKSENKEKFLENYYDKNEKQQIINYGNKFISENDSIESTTQDELKKNSYYLKVKDDSNKQKAVYDSFKFKNALIELDKNKDKLEANNKDYFNKKLNALVKDTEGKIKLYGDFSDEDLKRYIEIINNENIVFNVKNSNGSSADDIKQNIKDTLTAIITALKISKTKIEEANSNNDDIDKIFKEINIISDSSKDANLKFLNDFLTKYVHVFENIKKQINTSISNLSNNIVNVNNNLSLAVKNDKVSLVKKSFEKIKGVLNDSRIIELVNGKRSKAAIPVVNTKFKEDYNFIKIILSLHETLQKYNNDLNNIIKDKIKSSKNGDWILSLKDKEGKTIIIKDYLNNINETLNKFNKKLKELDDNNIISHIDNVKNEYEQALKINEKCIKDIKNLKDKNYRNAFNEILTLTYRDGYISKIQEKLQKNDKNDKDEVTNYLKQSQKDKDDYLLNLYTKQDKNNNKYKEQISNNLLANYNEFLINHKSDIEQSYKSDPEYENSKCIKKVNEKVIDKNSLKYMLANYFPQVKDTLKRSIESKNNKIIESINNEVNTASEIIKNYQDIIDNAKSTNKDSNYNKYLEDANHINALQRIFTVGSSSEDVNNISNYIDNIKKVLTNKSKLTKCINHATELLKNDKTQIDNLYDIRTLVNTLKDESLNNAFKDSLTALQQANSNLEKYSTDYSEISKSFEKYISNKDKYINYLSAITNSDGKEYIFTDNEKKQAEQNLSALTNITNSLSTLHNNIETINNYVNNETNNIDSVDSTNNSNNDEIIKVIENFNTIKDNLSNEKTISNVNEILESLDNSIKQDESDKEKLEEVKNEESKSLENYLKLFYQKSVAVYAANIKKQYKNNSKFKKLSSEEKEKFIDNLIQKYKSNLTNKINNLENNKESREEIKNKYFNKEAITAADNEANSNTQIANTHIVSLKNIYRQNILYSNAAKKLENEIKEIEKNTETSSDKAGMHTLDASNNLIDFSNNKVLPDFNKDKEDYKEYIEFLNKDENLEFLKGFKSTLHIRTYQRINENINSLENELKKAELELQDNKQADISNYSAIKRLNKKLLDEKPEFESFLKNLKAAIDDDKNNYTSSKEKANEILEKYNNFEDKYKECIQSADLKNSLISISKSKIKNFEDYISNVKSIIENLEKTISIADENSKNHINNANNSIAINNYISQLEKSNAAENIEAFSKTINKKLETQKQVKEDIDNINKTSDEIKKFLSLENIYILKYNSEEKNTNNFAILKKYLADASKLNAWYKNAFTYKQRTSDDVEITPLNEVQDKIKEVNKYIDKVKEFVNKENIDNVVKAFNENITTEVSNIINNHNDIYKTDINKSDHINDISKRLINIRTEYFKSLSNRAKSKLNIITKIFNISKQFDISKKIFAKDLQDLRDNNGGELYDKAKVLAQYDIKTYGDIKTKKSIQKKIKTLAVKYSEVLAIIFKNYSANEAKKRKYISNKTILKEGQKKYDFITYCRYIENNR